MPSNPVAIIRKKRDGIRLTHAEIQSFVEGLMQGTIPDYQCAAFLMAVYFQGMDFRETSGLTQAMMSSGKVLNLSGIRKPKVDKHSTGGVGDKVSLILAPLIASCGVCVPMISGRSLGHTGGTLDKLESIPGFRTKLSINQLTKQLRKIGITMIGQTADIAPADRKLYALRDVTATIDSIPLIAASIMSKKLAEDLDGLVLDVKCGNGAFMKEHTSAKALAQTMIHIGKQSGVNVVALVSDMSNPLGEYCGNSLEVIESIEALKGRGSKDVMEITYALGEAMLSIAKIKGGRKLLQKKIKTGEALQKFKEMIAHQGGDTRVLDDYMRLPVARNTMMVRAHNNGYIHHIDTFQLGMLLVHLGGGRLRKEDTIDRACGFRIFKKIGDCVAKAEPLIEIITDNRARAKHIAQAMPEVFLIRAQPCRHRKLIHTLVR